MCPESRGVVTLRRRLQSNGWRLVIPVVARCFGFKVMAPCSALLKAELSLMLVENDLHSRKRMGSVASRSQL